MKKILLYIGVLWVVTMVASCEIETSSDGNLYGFWHLVGIDSISQDASGAHVDLSQQLLFWAIQSQLVELTDQNQLHSPIVCRFTRERDSLFFETPYYLNREEGDPPVIDIERMRYYGLGSMQPRMLIESLSSNKMIVNTGEVRLRFKKL